MSKVHPRASFEKVHEIESIYTGGKVAVSRDEKILVTAAGEEVHITDLATGKKLHKLQGDSDTVTSFALAGSSKLVTASRSLLLTSWDLTTGEQLRSWKAHEAPVIMMEFDPSNVLLATGSADSTIKLWDTEKGICTHNLKGHRGIISALKFHPDGNRWTLISGADDCQVRIWNLLTKKCTAVLDSHVSVIRGLDVSPCGWHLISGSRDKVVNIWDLKTNQLERTLPILETIEDLGILTHSEVSSFTETSPQGLFFFTAGDGGRIKVWRWEDGRCVYEQPKVDDLLSQALTGAFRTFETNMLVTVSVDQTISFHSLAENFRCIKQIAGYNEEVIDISFVGSKQDKLAVITNSEQLRVYDLRNNDCAILHGHTDTILSMSKHNNAPYLATASKDNTARIWRFEESAVNREQTCYTVAQCTGHAESVGAVEFATKSMDFILTASQDHTVKKWDCSSLEKSASDQVVELKSVFTVTAHDKDINDVTVAPNDKLFATCSQDRTAKIWNASTGAEIATLKGHKRGVWCVRFSPVDQVLASASGDKTVKLWSLTDFTCVRTFEGHTNSVLRLEFLTMGTQILSAGSDGLTKLWTVKTSECETTLDDHDDKIWALAVREPPASIRTDTQQISDCVVDEKDIFSETSCLVASGGGDSLITIYRDVTVQALKDLHDKEELRLLQDQALTNFIVKKDYKRAILLALELDKPVRLCSLFSEVLDEGKKEAGSVLGDKELDRIIIGLNITHLQKLFDYIRTWNTNAKTARTAQAVLHVLIKNFAVQELIKIPKIKDYLDALIPYTDRHYARVDQLLTQSWLIDYSLSEMDSLMADMQVEDSIFDEDNQAGR